MNVYSETVSVSDWHNPKWQTSGTTGKASKLIIKIIAGRSHLHSVTIPFSDKKLINPFAHQDSRESLSNAALDVVMRKAEMWITHARRNVVPCLKK